MLGIKKSLLFFVIFLFFGINSALSQDKLDSLYNNAWDKHNAGEFKAAAIVFEKCLNIDGVWRGTHLNAASSWALYGSESRAIYHLTKLVEKGYLDKDLILDCFPEFSKFYNSSAWKNLMELLDKKRDSFYDYAKRVGIQKLSKEQMYEDFDILTSNIRNLSIQLSVMEKIGQLNYERIFSEYRGKIKTCRGTSDFIKLLYCTLIACQDGHTGFSRLNSFELLNNGDDKDYCATIANYDLILKSFALNISELPEFVYHDGKYFLASEYCNNDINLSRCSQLIAVNGEEPDNYLRNEYDKKRNLQWDFAQKSFYSNRLLDYNICNGSQLSCKLSDNGVVKNITIDLVGKLQNKSVDDRNGRVEYWKNEEVLYIRLPRMYDDILYLDEIRKYHDENIQKIIIDIRGNKGGADFVWEDIIMNLIDKEIKIEMEYACTKDYQKQDSSFNNMHDLFGMNIFSKRIKRNIPVDSNSIRFSKKIFILFDDECYSSAGSLVRACDFSDQLVSVGITCGRILGMGIDPIHRCLPNTKLTYRLAPLIDMSGVNKIRDIFHDEPEIHLGLDLNDKINLRFNTYKYEFLMNKDPYVRKVIELN
ncbi:S41 family peptidase [Ancylomarina sp. DW003]|nr:S41 family peptidase [Ancylomarina sp. DW003]MDE5423192.1 S41 family peptidase [Ancylomarina sp. DW003]